MSTNQVQSDVKILCEDVSYHEMILIFSRAPTLGEGKGLEATELSLELAASIKIAHETDMKTKY